MLKIMIIALENPSKSLTLYNIASGASYISKIKTRILTIYETHYDIFGASFNTVSNLAFFDPLLLHL